MIILLYFFFISVFHDLDQGPVQPFAECGGSEPREILQDMISCL